MDSPTNSTSQESLPVLIEKPRRKIHSIYFAAALFNTKECFFNIAIARKLEALSHTVYLPQRDGFEFSQLT